MILKEEDWAMGGIVGLKIDIKVEVQEYIEIIHWILDRENDAYLSPNHGFSPRTLTCIETECWVWLVDEIDITEFKLRW